MNDAFVLSVIIPLVVLLWAAVIALIKVMFFD